MYFAPVRFTNDLLCSAEGDSAVGRGRVLRGLHPHLRHHCEYRVSVSQGRILDYFCLLLCIVGRRSLQDY